MTPARPNVLMIVVDDLRPAIAALGHPRAITPNLDRLLKTGAGFSAVHCQHPICTASRASALTGCQPVQTHVHDLDTRLSSVRPDLITLPRCFRDAGYETTTVGKVFHHGDDNLDGWSRRVPVAIKHPTHALPENVAINHAYHAAKQRGQTLLRGPAIECAELPDEAYVDAEIAARAIDVLGESRDRPFFLATGFIKPHLPFTCPKKYWDLYDRAALADALPGEALVNPAPHTVHDWGELRFYSGIPPAPAPVPPDQRAELIHGYYACVSYLDAQVGKLLDALDRLGLSDSTIVCLWADHGLMLGEYGMWAKHTLLDAATRVPLIIRDPRRAGGGLCRRIVELLDLFPTLAALCDIAVPDTVDGVSLIPLMEDPAQPWKDIAFSEYPRGRHAWGYSVRTPEFRYTEWRSLDQSLPVQRELYDMRHGGAETVNIVDRPEHAQSIATLKRELDEHFASAWSRVQLRR